MTTSNVDPQEIEKFNQIASDWWNPDGKMKPLHQLNPLRLAYIQQYAELNDNKVIDVGCGGGILSESLARANANVTAIDMSEQALKVAKQHADSQSLAIDYQHTTVEHIASTQVEQFDVVTCMEMLEHVPDPAKIIQACAELVKPGGYLFFSTIHRNPKAYIHAVIGAEYLLNLLPKGTHEYEKFIKPSELDEWASQAELSLLNLSGVTYSPFKGEFKLSTDVSVNYLCAYQKKAN